MLNLCCLCSPSWLWNLFLSLRVKRVKGFQWQSFIFSFDSHQEFKEKRKTAILCFGQRKCDQSCLFCFFSQDFLMGTSFYLHSFLLLTPLLTSPCDAFDPLIITTKKGQVQGKFVPVQHNQVGAFLGIPYGKPPVGKLRFRPPVPADSWEGVKDATEYPNSCFQPNLTRTCRFGV